MDQGRKVSRRRLIVLFVVYLCIALVFFGSFAYLVIVKRTEGAVSDRLVTVSKILVLAGIFFLVLDFYLGITQSHLLIIECGNNKHYYQYSNEPDMQSMDVEELSAELNWEDIGTTFFM